MDEMDKKTRNEFYGHSVEAVVSNFNALKALLSSDGSFYGLRAEVNKLDSKVKSLRDDYTTEGGMNKISTVLVS